MTQKDIGKSFTYYGWVVLPDRKLSLNLQFAILRDHDGQTLQLRFTKPIPKDLTSEAPVIVRGTLVLRPEEDRRPEILGSYELEVDNIRYFNIVKFKLPFKHSDTPSVSLETRLRYRYLGLRYDGRFMRLRSSVLHDFRRWLSDEKFYEIETPLLFKSTPEGAREFLVPTRRQGEFYALPQSPQQYKQLLMAAGFQKYFQFAKCFRDEDLRADRQPEFTQVFMFPTSMLKNIKLDLEMAFAGSHEVMNNIERLLASAFSGVDLPFPVMTYETAMDKVFPMCCS